jgi:hypothetical protein
VKVPKIQEGKPLDEVLFTRDEMANMVWAIEKTLPLANGGTKRGHETARELRSFFERHALVGGPTAPAHPPSAKLRYEVMSAVAEHWIPFVAARKSGSTREVLLQRASMLRLIEGDPAKPRRIVPLTATLREGLDRAPPGPYLVNEEEIPRSGARVTRSFQRTRWQFGRTSVWIGMRKQNGRGEGASGLGFDNLVDQKL